MTLKIFVGTEPKTKLMYRVLRHSILKHASGPVEITPMEGSGWEYSLDGIKVGTGFSLRRWMIPAACGWQGHALYVDADQILLSDVTKILADAKKRKPADSPVVYTTFQPDKFKKAPWPQTSVMLIDCEKAKPLWGFYIDKILFHLKKRNTQQDYANFMHVAWLEPSQVGELPVYWNHLNEYKPGVTKLLHYTSEPNQPPYKPEHPLAGLWVDALEEAIKDGHVPKAEIEFALSQWNVKQDWRNNNGLHPSYARVLHLYK